MTPIKVGDSVECVHNSEWESCLTIGQIYKVDGVYQAPNDSEPDAVYVKDNAGIGFYYDVKYFKLRSC